MADFKTPLAKVRGLGSGKTGTHHWLMQRVTAIANIPLSLFMLVSFFGLAGKGHTDWVAWLQQPVVAVLVSLFLLNTLHHMRLGLQVFIEDYVHSAGSKMAALLAVNFAAVLMAALGVFSVLKVAFAG